MQENIHQISRAQLSFEDLQTIILEDKQIVKTIFIRDKLINLIIK